MGRSTDASIARPLAEHRGVRNHLQTPRLTIRQILAWADVRFRRSDKWRRKAPAPFKTLRAKHGLPSTPRWLGSCAVFGFVLRWLVYLISIAAESGASSRRLRHVTTLGATHVCR